MKVRLTRRNRIEKGSAGEIVEVSPDRAAFLLQYGLADPVTIREQIETPEEPEPEKKTATKAAAKKTTRKQKT